MSPMMANMMNLPTLLIVILVILLLFGSHKIPQLMRGLGSGINEFKKGLADGEGEKKAEEQKAADAKPAEAKPAEAAKPAEKAPEGTPKA